MKATVERKIAANENEKSAPPLSFPVRANIITEIRVARVPLTAWPSINICSFDTKLD